MTNQQQQERDRRDQQKRDEVWKNQNQVQGQSGSQGVGRPQDDRQAPAPRGEQTGQGQGLTGAFGAAWKEQERRFNENQSRTHHEDRNPNLTPADRNRQQQERNRQQRSQQLDAQHERNARAQNTGGNQVVDMEEVNDLVRSGYETVEQPGLHPANLPGRRLDSPDGRSFKPNHDLEDITGNPGHLNVNPNAPATSINPAPQTGAPGPESINEPPDVRQAPAGGSIASINEPPGSNAVPGEATNPGEGEGGGEGGNPPVLTSLDPDNVAVGSGPMFTLHVTGENFDNTCKIVFDDDELDTNFINANQLYADVPIQEFPGEVDVEVHRGDEMSDVLTFEFIAAQGGTRSRERPARKPKKSVPASKRLKKHKR